MSIKIIDLVYKADLPRAEKAILLAYADHADDNGKSIYPSYGRIAWKTGYHRVHVIRITRRLIDSGILVVCGVHPSGTNILRIDLDRLPSRPDYNAITDTADAVDKPPIHNPDGESEILPEQVQIATPQVTNCYPTQLQNVTPPVAKCYPNRHLTVLKKLRVLKRARIRPLTRARASQNLTLLMLWGVWGAIAPHVLEEHQPPRPPLRRECPPMRRLRSGSRPLTRRSRRSVTRRL